MKLAPQEQEDARSDRRVTGTKPLPRAYAIAVAELNPLTWSLALERAFYKKSLYI